MAVLRVEVFPIAPDRWIAAFEDFSTEARRPEDVEREVRSALAEVFGSTEVPFVLVDERGVRWSLDVARAQAARLADA